MTAHVATQSQNLSAAWPLMRHFAVSPPSWTKNIASISALVITPKNSEWLPSSSWSFVDDVAVQASR